MNVEKLKDDILFQIDMYLYNKYNAKLSTMYDYLGDIYTYRDIEEIEQLEKDDKICLLTQAVKDLQKELRELKKEGKK